MTVYVESNFVMEQALQQEQCEACDRIAELASSGTITLVIPSFSLAEPHQALALKKKTRNRLSNELRTQIVEIGRSRQYRGILDNFAALTSVLIQSGEEQRDGLQNTIRSLLTTAEVVPLDAEILLRASTLESKLGMSGQDAIVLASVLRHLQATSPLESCFLSRNSRDFDDPGVRDELDRFGCRYFAQFETALHHIVERVRSKGSPAA